MRAGQGYRGYISSRTFGGERAPQHIQNLVVRSYCNELGIPFRLSATEVAMPGTYIMLDQMLEEIDTVAGLVFYSIQQLPEDEAHRARITSVVLGAGREIHFAVERLLLKTPSDELRINDLLGVSAILPYTLKVDECQWKFEDA